MLDNNMLNDRIERLRRVLDDLHIHHQADHIDLSDPTAVSKKQREIDELFEPGQSAPHGDSALGYLVLKRRKEAVLDLLSEAEDRFAAAYPDLCVPDELVRFNTPSAPLTFGSLNKEYYIELAAAIWLLDYLKYSNTFEEASRYFPSSRAELDSVYLPLLSDSVHSDDELRSMLYIIRSRNRGMKGFDEECAFCGDADTGYKKTPEDAELPDRKNFDAIISLIDPEIIGACREGVTELIWSYFDSLLALISGLRGELTQSRQELRKGIEDLIGQYDMARTNAPSPLSVNAKEDIIRGLVKDAPAPESLPGLTARLNEIGRLEEKVKEAVSAIESAYCLHLLAPGWLDGKLPSDRSMDIFADMTVPEIGDPYDVCFAFLSLLDANDDHAWLYNLSCGAVAYACRLLPWADSGVIDPDADTDELRIDYEYLSSLVQKDPDWTEDEATGKLYDMSVPSPLLRERRADTSIAKLAFLTSGLIPPRTGISISFTKALLAETRLSPDAQDMIFNYFALAYSVSHKGSDFRTLDDDRIAGEFSDGTDTAEDKDAEIKRLRAEIKHLKNVVNQMEHRGKDLSSELSDSKHKLEAANTELAELRTMIRESCDDAGSAPTVIDFPFKAERRTVIIGGHESWLKAIRPLLENVRYIGASEQPNPGVILNSEVVWFQSNAMGHSGFYKIIDIVRKNGIKVCYFKYASAEKCAEQLALEELGSRDES